MRCAEQNGVVCPSPVVHRTVLAAFKLISCAWGSERCSPAYRQKVALEYNLFYSGHQIEKAIIERIAMVQDFTNNTEIQNPSFPSEYAETLNYTLGTPKAFSISKNGNQIFFLRSRSGTDRRLELWTATLKDSMPRLLDERRLISIDELDRAVVSGVNAPKAERLRKERLREAASGITAYSIDNDGRFVGFSVGGQVFVRKTTARSPLHCVATEGATDVALSPDGRKLAYVEANELYVAEIGPRGVRKGTRISPAATATLSWGLPDFIAAEEMDRFKAYWWFPDSSGIIYIGTDTGSVEKMFISNPTFPNSQPALVRYPRAGTENAKLLTRIWRHGRKGTNVAWDNLRYPYIAGVEWKVNTPYLSVQTRLEKELLLLEIDVTSGRTKRAYRKYDPKWVELFPGTPTWSEKGLIIDILDRETRCLTVAGRTVSQKDVQVRRFVGELSTGELAYVGSDDPTESHIWLADQAGGNIRLTKTEGVYNALASGKTIVVEGNTLSARPSLTKVFIRDQQKQSELSITSQAKTMSAPPMPVFMKTQDRGINFAVLYPKDFKRDHKLPVILDPYGGPLIQRCTKSALSFSVSQWFANQGFAVIVADGRGSPGRGRDWEKAIAGDFVKPILDDQISVLNYLADIGEPIATERVAIRGWSFGGYLAALAVLQRPDRFHVAVAGAPVTDWRLYDTHYTERYLGLPQRRPAIYDACSLLKMAPLLERPLLLIHGLSDDNVFCAHTLKMSQALFEAGKEHYVLPLTDITHMTASAIAARALLLAQLRFIKEGLAH